MKLKMELTIYKGRRFVHEKDEVYKAYNGSVESEGISGLEADDSHFDFYDNGKLILSKDAVVKLFDIWNGGRSDYRIDTNLNYAKLEADESEWWLKLLAYPNRFPPVPRHNAMLMVYQEMPGEAIQSKGGVSSQVEARGSSYEHIGTFYVQLL